MRNSYIGFFRGDELREWISRETFTEITQPLIGLPVSWAWRGYGSAIFLEFGNLIEEKPQNESNIHISRRGEIRCMIEGSWRVERPRSILFGSDDGKRKIENGLVKLRESHVVQISIEGRLPEIAFELTCGYWVRSFMSWGGQPDWCLFFSKGVAWRDLIYVRRGKLELSHNET